MLADAVACLAQGEWARARHLATACVSRAVERRDDVTAARALTLVARTLVFGSRLDLAHDAADMACARARAAGHATALFEALCVCSYVQTSRGQRAPALALAEEAITLAAALPNTQARATALNYRGLCKAWARDYDAARTDLDAALDLLQGLGSDASFHPLVGIVCTEMLRVADDPLAVLTPLKRLVRLALHVAETSPVQNLSAVPLDVAFYMLHVTDSLVASREGRLTDAEQAWAASQLRAARLPRDSWLLALGWWARLGIATASGNLAQAKAALLTMQHLAQRAQHQPLVTLAARLTWWETQAA